MSDFFSLAPPKTRKIYRCRPLAPASAPSSRGLRLFWQRLAQSFRLMVGVQDYQNYLRHMQQHHPAATPMTEKAFHRYCLEARFPSKGGKIGKCPC
ncbi:CstA-like transporter-associated (seleno)protein [Mixta calida]|uniref:YbdD/YjiX family protein n=1 Tax=Mixta calida TaxID=665913 RepID=UPI00290B91F1|nr:CstA-like transporter-associated (seleno)protein [Mixta calida]MDU6413323.1 CstA-like transporter-associated (seleno)protein [Mixta calida]